MRYSILGLSLGLFLVCGCGSDPDAVSPASAQVQTGVAAREGSSGTLAVNGQVLPLDLEWERQGSSLRGVGRLLIEDTRAVTGRLEGTDDGTRHRFTLDLRPDFPLTTFTGTTSATGFSGIVDAGTTASTATRPQTVALDNGTYQTQKTSATASSTPFGGLYTVTLDDGTVLNLEGTQAIPGDPNLPGLNTSNVVTAYVSDDNDVEPADAGGGSYIAGNLYLRVNPFDSQKYPFITCFLSGSLQSGKYTQFKLGGSPPIKQGTYTMRSGF